MMLKPNSLVAGASGATWGVMASLGVWLFLYRQHFKASIVDDFAKRLMLAVVINGAISFWPRVSWEGHMGGAIGGVAMAFALDLIRPGHRRRTIAGIVAAIAFPIAIVAALGAGGGEVRRLAAIAGARSPAAADHLPGHSAAGVERDQPERGAQFRASLGKPRTLWMVIRSAKNIEKAKQLQEKAEQMRERIASHAAPPRLIAEMPEKAIAYCDAVREFTQRLIEFLQGDRDDLDAVGEAKGELDSRWQALHQNSLMK